MSRSDHWYKHPQRTNCVSRSVSQIPETPHSDNTKAIIVQPDALTPHITLAFLEYAQARKFHVDPA
jgi:hypothetical protein